MIKLETTEGMIFLADQTIESGVYKASRQASALARALVFKILSEELRPI